MIEILPFENDKVIGMRISGKVRVEGLEMITKAIDEKLERHEKLNVYLEFDDVSKLSNDAFIENLKFTFSHLGDFEKEAIVSDQGWLGMLIKITDKLYQSVEVRHFKTDQRIDALRWIQE